MLPSGPSEPTGHRHRAGGGLRVPLVLTAVSALFALPVLWVPFPPMVDYPQHLAMAAVVRFHGQAGWGFGEVFRLVLWRPHGAFELLTAGLAWLLPLPLAGRLVVAASVAALGPAAWSLARRGGSGGPWALAVLACGYGYAFWFGFVGTLLGYPLFLLGLALADRALEEGKGAPTLVVLGVLFYTVHLQLLVLLFGSVACLVACRGLAGKGWRWRPLVALLPGVAVATAALVWARFLVPAEELSALERAVRAAPAAWNPPLAKLAQVTGLTFGVHPGGAELVASGLLLVLIVAGIALRRRTAPAQDPRGDGRWGWATWLRDHRLAVVAAALAGVYLLAPERASGYLVAGRIAPLAVMVALCALPPPRLARRRFATALVAALLVLQLGVVTSDLLVFRREARGVREVLAATRPGHDLLGLVFEPYSSRTPVFPVFRHFPAYYQVYRGGRVLGSMADFFHTVVDYRPGRDWGSLPVVLSERNPQDFRFEEHGAEFEYFLVRGPAALVPALFGAHRRDLAVVSAGSWHLVAREPGLLRTPAGEGFGVGERGAAAR